MQKLVLGQSQGLCLLATGTRAMGGWIEEATTLIDAVLYRMHPELYVLFSCLQSFLCHKCCPLSFEASLNAQDTVASVIALLSPKVSG